MSSGLSGDWPATNAQLKTPYPCRDGFTWLRHKENAQSGQIDIMVLEGKHSLGNMVDLLRKKNLFKPGLPDRQCQQRVRDHLSHLQEGCSRSLANGQEPHHLLLKEVSGKWRFSLDGEFRQKPIDSSRRKIVAPFLPSVSNKIIPNLSDVKRTPAASTMKYTTIRNLEETSYRSAPAATGYASFLKRIFKGNRTKWWADLDGEVWQGRSGQRYLQDTLEKELRDVPDYRNSATQLFFFSDNVKSSIDGRYGDLGVEVKYNRIKFSKELIDGAIHRGFVWVVGNPQRINQDSLEAVSLYVVRNGSEALTREEVDIYIPVLKAVAKMGILVLFIDGKTGETWKVAGKAEAQAPIPAWFSYHQPKKWDLELELITSDMRYALDALKSFKSVSDHRGLSILKCIPGFTKRFGTFREIALDSGCKAAVMEYGNEWRVIELGLILRSMGYDAAIVKYKQEEHKNRDKKRPLDLAGRGVEKRIQTVMKERFNVLLDWEIKL